MDAAHGRLGSVNSHLQSTFVTGAEVLSATFSPGPAPAGLPTPRTPRRRDDHRAAPCDRRRYETEVQPHRERATDPVGRILRDAGYEVIYTGLFQTPETVAAAAVDEDVDAIGLSMLSGAHMTLASLVVEEVRKRGSDIPVIWGGIVPDSIDTVWVLGDQLNRSLGALAAADPATHRVLMVESAAKLGSKRWHRQRAHFVIASMRRFATELGDAGFTVDYRRVPSLRAGYMAHVAEFSPSTVLATEPASIDGLALLRSLDVELVRTNQFLCHYDEFAAPRAAAGCSGVSADDFDDWAVVEGCYKVYEDVINGKTLRVYYPDWYEQVPDRAQMPLLAREALVESMTMYASFADVGDVNLIFSLIDTIDSDGTLAVAASDSQWGLASIAGACPITIFPLSFTGADRFKQTVAHELWHCVQRENGYPDGSVSGTSWIVEGGAEFMSNVVYPGVNDEWGWVDNFDRQSRTTAIFDIDYPAWLWWQYIGSQQGPAAVVTLMQTMIDAGDGGKAIMAASYGPDFQRFIVDFMAGEIPDSGGNVPRGEQFIGSYRKVVNNDDGKTLDFEVAPFVGARWVIEYDKQLRVTEVDRTSTVGELAMTRWADRADRTAWKQVAPEVRSKCQNKEYHMLAATTHQGTHKPKIEILETEQAVCDPCLLGTWDLRLDTFKGMILAAAGGDLPAGADFSFGGNYYLEFDDLGDFKEQREALGIIASLEGNSITFTIDSFATGRYTADGENISILDIVELYVNVTSPFGGPGFSDSNVFTPGGGGTYVCDDDVLTVTVTGFPPISWDRVDKILRPDNTIPA